MLSRARCFFLTVALLTTLLVIYLGNHGGTDFSRYREVDWKSRQKPSQKQFEQNSDASEKLSYNPSLNPPPYTATLSPDTQQMASVTVSYVAASKSPAAIKDKVIVTGHTLGEDVSWLKEKLPDWQHAVYIIVPESSSNTSDVDPQYVLPSGKGRESLAYLTYITQHYDALPELMVFIHPHDSGWPAAWHTEGFRHSNADAVERLNSALVRKLGYVNFRCTDDPGCPDPLHPNYLDPNGREPQPHLLAAFRGLFPGVEPPREVAATCCAQFAVAAWRVRERERHEYVRLRSWLLATDLDDDVSGRVFEYLWHVIFRRPSVDCPTPRVCYCQVYDYACPD